MILCDYVIMNLLKHAMPRDAGVTRSGMITEYM